LITAYALAIVVGGPIMTLSLARFEKRKVLLGLMALFIAGNLIGAVTTNYIVLLISRVIAGLTQGPFMASARLWRPSSFLKSSPAKPLDRCSPG
jgi:DHA1 family inner membrane transport protein